MTLEKNKIGKRNIFVLFRFRKRGRKKANDLGPCGANDCGGKTPGHRLFDLN